MSFKNEVIYFIFPNGEKFGSKTLKSKSAPVNSAPDYIYHEKNRPRLIIFLNKKLLFPWEYESLGHKLNYSRQNKVFNNKHDIIQGVNSPTVLQQSSSVAVASWFTAPLPPSATTRNVTFPGKHVRFLLLKQSCPPMWIPIFFLLEKKKELFRGVFI